VWQGRDDTDYEIFVYDGSAVVQLTDNTVDDWGPKINNRGQVVWYRNDGMDYEIFLATPSAAEAMSEIVSFFDDGITNKTIKAKVPKDIRNTGDRTEIRKAKHRRIRLMRQLLGEAQELIDAGLTVNACGVLEAAYPRCDGQKIPPADWFKGEDLPELAGMIQDLMTDLDCQ
jgi:hypothetical protein